MGFPKGNFKQTGDWPFKFYPWRYIILTRKREKTNGKCNFIAVTVAHENIYVRTLYKHITLYFVSTVIQRYAAFPIRIQVFLESFSNTACRYRYIRIRIHMKNIYFLKYTFTTLVPKSLPILQNRQKSRNLCPSKKILASATFVLFSQLALDLNQRLWKR